MTDNIVSAISRFLTPELIGKMASVAGLDRGTTQSAVGAFVPAILSGLADLAAKPGGARQLTDAIAEQPSGMLSNLAQTLGGSSMSAEKGSGILSSLLGGGVLNTLVSTLSRFVGIGEGSTRTLMGLLMPVVLGILGREQRAAGLETGGLARMLMGQRDQITAAMPVGLSDLLSSRVRMQEDTARPEPRTYAEGRGYEAPETHIPRAATPGARRPVETREPESSWNWAYWVVPLLALGGLLWYLLPGTQTGTDRTAIAPTTSNSAHDTQRHHLDHASHSRQGHLLLQGPGRLDAHRHVLQPGYLQQGGREDRLGQGSPDRPGWPHPRRGTGCRPLPRDRRTGHCRAALGHRDRPAPRRSPDHHRCGEGHAAGRSSLRARHRADSLEAVRAGPA